MKSLTSLLFLLVASLMSIAQTQCGHEHMISEDIKADSTFARRILPGITHTRSVFEQKTLPVIVHIFHEGENYGEGSHLTQEVVIEAIDHLNLIFAGLTENDNNTFIDFCISNETLTGAQSFGILYHDLNDYVEYDGPIDNIVDNQFYVGLQQTYGYSVSDYMEIFVAPWSTGWSGFSSPPPSSLGVWVRTNRFGFGDHVTSSQNQNTTLSHEVGHWSGLMHTFYTYSSCEEAQAEADCVNQGDYVCDTQPTVATSGCSSGCGEDPFNIMGYYPGTCRTGFTEGQIERMHSILELSRNQQINNSFCTGMETGCLDTEACNYDLEAIYEDGSCEYADPGFDCEGNAVVSIQELIYSDQITSYACYDLLGREVDLDKVTQTGTYILRLTFIGGKTKVDKIYLTR